MMVGIESSSQFFQMMPPFSGVTKDSGGVSMRWTAGPTDLERKPLRVGFFFEIPDSTSFSQRGVFMKRKTRLLFFSYHKRFHNIHDVTLVTGVVAAKTQRLAQNRHLEKKASYFRSTPHPVTVTTRIITFLIGNPYKPSFATVTGWGVDPNHIFKGR